MRTLWLPVRTLLLVALALLVGTTSSVYARGFADLPADPKPPKTTRSNHYVVSNERRHFLFRESVENVGGVFVGVGSDQVYLMAGWAKPEVLIPMDFDQFIVDLHGIYRLAFLKSETPEAFLKLWNDASRMKTLVKEGAGSDDKKAKLLNVLDFGRKAIAARLGRVKRQYSKLNVATFLTDASQYNFLVELFKADKVFPVRGDLTKKQTMQGIAAATRKANLHVGAIYLSNAEQYFTFSQQYRDNIAAMPFNEKSLVLRTFPDGKKGYYYFTQSGKLFQNWMERAKIRKVFSMLKTKRAVAGTHNRFFRLESEPPKRWLRK